MAESASITATLIDDHPVWGRCVFLEATGPAEAIRGETNWRVTNLGASRFWPARGFRLMRLRLVRRLPDL